MPAANILITGCNRGIGLELVRQLLKQDRKPENLFATCRDPEKATELRQIAKDNPNLHVLKLDVTDHSAYDSVSSSVRDKVGDSGLNLLINNAGVLFGEGSGGEDDPNRAAGKGELTPDSMRQSFEVNCIAQLFFTKKLLPMVQQAADKGSSQPVSASRAAVVMMSTAVSSIKENSGGGNYAYRCSKVALNMAMKNLSVELKEKGILVMCMHPGWVRTDMGGPRGLIDAEECVSNMLKTIEGLSDKDLGAFLRYNNTTIPW